MKKTAFIIFHLTPANKHGSATGFLQMQPMMNYQIFVTSATLSQMNKLETILIVTNDSNSKVSFVQNVKVK